MPKGLQQSWVTRSLGSIVGSSTRTKRGVWKNDNSYTWSNFELGINLSQVDIYNPMDIEFVVVDIDHDVAIDPILNNDSIVDVDLVLVDIDPNVASAQQTSRHHKNCKIMDDGFLAIYITPSQSTKRVAPFVNNASTRASTSHSVHSRGN